MKKLALWSVLALICGWAALVVYWLAFDNPILFTQLDGWVESEEGIIHPGSVIYTQRRFCLYRSIIPASVVRTIANDFVLKLTDIDFEAGVGCYNSRRRVVLPTGISPGHYFYKITTTFQVNPLVTKTVDWPAIEFEVTPR